jgi:hypothetical protein
VDARAGAPDSVFANIPIDRWSEKEQDAHLRWTTQISKPVLSPHQRLMIRIRIQVDGAELTKRKGQGRMLLLVQLRDEAGRIFQNHNSLALGPIRADGKQTAVEYSQAAFVIPGDYQVSLGMFIPSTGEHAITRRSLHVRALFRDPLPDAWRDLPSVEFLEEGKPPDSWYLPKVEGRLHLPIETRRPVTMELLVNGSPSEQAPRTRQIRAARRGSSAVIPVAKTISQFKLSNGSSKVTILDLERRRVIFEQTLSDRLGLDWSKLKASLAEADPNKIDVGSLGNRHHNAEFFVSQVQHRLADLGEGRPLRVLIIVSELMAFGQADASPLQAAENPDCKNFYVRLHPMTRLPPIEPETSREPLGASTRIAGGSRSDDSRPDRIPAPGQTPTDQLFDLVKPLHPRLFEVSTPGQLRRAIAIMQREIARLAND